MSALAEAQRAFARICMAPEPAEEDLAVLHDDPERWLLYRGMVRSRLFSMMRMGLPKSAEVLGDEVFDAAVARYLADRGPQTRFLREVVHELVEHALPSWEADPSLPAHTADLVRYEDLKWRVGALPWELEGEPGELDFEAICVLNPTARVVVVRHRVDKDPERPVALDQPHHAVVYRKPDSGRLFTYVLNDIGGRLLAAWSEEQTCADGARQVLSELDREPDPRFIEGMAGVLAELFEQRVILGSRR